MTTTQPTLLPNGEIDWRLTPHRYVAPAVSGWRTCAVCGVGANGSIHRHEEAK